MFDPFVKRQLYNTKEATRFPTAFLSQDTSRGIHQLCFVSTPCRFNSTGVAWRFEIKKTSVVSDMQTYFYTKHLGADDLPNGFNRPLVVTSNDQGSSRVTH